MPEKYHIEATHIAPRLPRIGKYGIVDWREDCARCHNCVKNACIYDKYREESKFIRSLANDKTAVMVVEHDLIIMDYMADLVHLMYGKENCYGIKQIRHLHFRFSALFFAWRIMKTR